MPARLRLLAALALLGLAHTAAGRPNVLLIAIDDLNDWVGCLGGHPQAETPNIDRLAERGTLFTNAHCQAPICNPSRTSIMLGLRPSTTGIYDNRPSHWAVPELKGKVTMPSHFAQSGYHTITAGKIYHGPRFPEGEFAQVGPQPGQRNGRLDQHIQKELKRIWDFGPQTFGSEHFSDHIIADYAIEVLGETHDKPFFFALGFYRPHVPWYAPAEFFDALPEGGIKPPPVKDDDRDDLPPAAIRLIANDVPPPHAWFLKGTNWRDALDAFTASVRFVDHQVGRVIDALDAGPNAQDTIVVLFSDHGFHLGEKQSWAKRSLWERSTRVPLLIATPGKPGGQRCGAPAELLSIYPTLIDLCELGGRDALEGPSLVALLDDAAAGWPHVAVTTFLEGNHTARDRGHRYIRYADGSEELYDLGEDPNEWTNLVGKEGSGAIARRLRQQLEATIGAPGAAADEQRPSPVTRVIPEVPDGIEIAPGTTVVVECTVDQRGRVVAPAIARSDNPALDRPTLEAVGQWRFKPGTKDGVAAEFKVRIPVRYGTD